MHPFVRALAVLACLVAAPAQAAVGFQHLTIPDPQGTPIEVGVWYPTDAAAKPHPIELFIQTLAANAPVKGRALPLVVLSHGNGGSYAGHADTAKALAEAGFVAATLTHTGDNWRDQSQATAIWQRPRHLKVLVDYMLTDWPQHDRLDGARIGAFGFSAGGFTVLAAAGGEPDLRKVAPHCRANPGFYDCLLLARQPHDTAAQVVWTHDPRIKAVVSAAPALGFVFGKEGLASVRQPLQLWRAVDDAVLPHPFYAEAVRAALPAAPDVHVVAGAGHYDFLQPCPALLAERNPQICKSAPGFDRAAFHDRLNGEVVQFFTRTLAGR